MPTDEELELEQKKRPPQPIGRPIVDPGYGQAHPAVDAPIGTPIAPPQSNVSPTNVLPGVDTRGVPAAMAPPEMATAAAPSAATTAAPSSIGEPIAPRTPRPQYHGLNRVLDTIAGATRIGSAIEAAGGLGTEGWRVKNADEERQIAEGEKERQANALAEETAARTGLAGAQAGEATARGEAAKAGMESVTVTDGTGKTWIIPKNRLEQFEQEQLKQQGANTREAGKEVTAKDIAAGKETSAEKIAGGQEASRERIAENNERVKQSIALANQALRRQTAGVKAPPEVAKAHAQLEGSISRMNVMNENKVKALQGDQQAMLSMLANHIGMTMGLVPGARINRQIYQEAEESAPWLQRVTAHFDEQGYLSGVVLTPGQMESMTELAVERLNEDRRNLADTEGYYGFHGQNEPAGGGENGKGTVNMRAPNGQIKPVPADQVDHYKAKGAVVVQ